MPKRRAEDAVELVMTDHWIRRKPPARDFLARIDTVDAAKKAKYAGPVDLFYPIAGDELYSAVAQVKEFTNLGAGIRRLDALLRRQKPERAEFYLDLAEAYRVDGQLEKAIPLYEEARRRDPLLARAHGQLGETLLRLNRFDEAVAVLEQGLRSIRDPEILLPLGVAYAQVNRIDDSVRTLTEAGRLNPDHAGTWLNLAVSLEHQGRIKEAEDAYRAAVRVQPDFAPAHDRLARLLDAQGDSRQAAYHRELVRRITSRATPRE
jgi:tetratricopeptide (TPR) repeat protein